MKVKIHSTDDLKELFLGTLLNNTDKVSKVSKHSSLSGIAYGVGKVGNKALKEVALLESRIFPSFARGEDLDFSGGEFGASPRFGASGSATSLRVIADPNTVYNSVDHVFSGTHGVEFEMTEASVTIDNNGYAYIPVRSRTAGSDTNVSANSILKVSTAPVGHKYVTNDYMAMGGRDSEDDMSFRARIKDSGNLSATSTTAMLTQALMALDSDVLKIIHKGYNQNGQVVLAIVTKNGKQYTEEELSSFLVDTEQYFCLQDIKSDGTTEQYGVQYVNVEYYDIDIDFRVSLEDTYTPNEVRTSVQMGMARLIDYRVWKNGGKIDWVNFLIVVKNTKGVRYCPDAYFTPNIDITVTKNMMPRFRQFIMRGMDGSIISDSGTTLNPIYYESAPDASYQTTVL